MKSLELTLARIGLLSTFFLLLACGGLFDGGGDESGLEFADASTRFTNSATVPVHMWVGSGAMTDQNRVEAGATVNSTTPISFTSSHSPRTIQVHAQRPDTALETATVEITYSQAISGHRIVATWSGAGTLSASVVPPN